MNFKPGNLVKLKDIRSNANDPRYIKFIGSRGIIEGVFPGLVEEMALITFGRLGRTVCNFSRLELISEDRFDKIKCRKRSVDVKKTIKPKMDFKQLWNFLKAKQK
jgi:hypothetical protein